MNVESTIRELVETHLSDNHNVKGIEFIDQLLWVAAQVGAINCTLANGRKLCFRIPGQSTWEVEVGRAKSKLRLLCARLAVLCHESGDPDVSFYGGEGLIHKVVPVKLPDDLGRSSGSGSGSSTATSLAPPPILKEWRVRFKNTPSEQEFTILDAVR